MIVKNADSKDYVETVPSGFADWMDYWAKGGSISNKPKKYQCAVHHKYEDDLEGAHVKELVNGIFEGDKIYIVPVCKEINDQFGKSFEISDDQLVEIPADHYSKK